MPVAGVRLCGRDFQPVQRYALGYKWVFGDVTVIVIIQEVMAEKGKQQPKRDNGQTEATE